MLPIVIGPNPVLSQIAKPVPIKSGPVPKITPHTKEVIGEMKKTLTRTVDPKGVGLAAPQVGKPLRIFIAKPTDKSKVMVFINPEVIQKSSTVNYIQRPKKDTSEKADKKLEGCLSLPTIWGPVLRNSSITISYLDEYGKSHKKKFSNFPATIVQHEMDHLNGILFPKRVLEQKGKLYKSEKDEKGEDFFEEIEI